MWNRLDVIMATDGQLARPFSKGCDYVHLFNCTKCERNDGRYNEALYYCPHCEHFYCKTCLQHACYHDLLGKKNIDQWGEASQGGNQSSECPDHPGNLLKSYCREHDKVLCPKCVAKEHGTCVWMENATDASAGVKRSDNLANESDNLSEQKQFDSNKINRSPGKNHTASALSRSESACSEDKNERSTPIVTVSNYFEADPNQPYKVNGTTRVNVRTADDGNACVITGMFSLRNGSIFLCDHANRKLKVAYDMKENVVDLCDLQGRPLRLSSVSENEVVVSYKRKLQFLSLASYDLTHWMPTDHDCDGLACHADDLIVTSRVEGTVYLYRLGCTAVSHDKPRLVRKVKYKTSLLSISSASPVDVSFSPGGSFIYIADSEKGLVTFDNQLQVLNTFHPSDVNGAKGVCVDSVGNVFVRFYGSNHVHQIHSSGVGKVTEIQLPLYMNPDSLIAFGKNTLILTEKSTLLHVLKLTQ